MNISSLPPCFLSLFVKDPLSVAEIMLGHENTSLQKFESLKADTKVKILFFNFAPVENCKDDYA